MFTPWMLKHIKGKTICKFHFFSELKLSLTKYLFTPIYLVRLRRRLATMLFILSNGFPSFKTPLAPPLSVMPVPALTAIWPFLPSAAPKILLQISSKAWLKENQTADNFHYQYEKKYIFRGIISACTCTLYWVYVCGHQKHDPFVRAIEGIHVPDSQSAAHNRPFLSADSAPIHYSNGQ